MKKIKLVWDKNNLKIKLVLNFIFLVLIILHIILYSQDFPHFYPTEDSRIQYCFGDEEALGIFDKETAKLFNLTELPFCISSGLTMKLSDYSSLLNETNKRTNLYAMIGYSIAFLITVISLVKIEK